VRVAPGLLGFDGRCGHRAGAADLAVRRDGAVPADLAGTLFIRTRPRMALFFSLMLDLRGSGTHSPARVPSVSRACSAGAVICPDGAGKSVSFSYRTGRGCMDPCPLEGVRLSSYDDTTPQNVTRRASSEPGVTGRNA